jgi:hypothetical protein
MTAIAVEISSTVVSEVNVQGFLSHSLSSYHCDSIFEQLVVIKSQRPSMNHCARASRSDKLHIRSSLVAR